eukprot:TRINITY_DN71657_c0_g1_i1.p1 TRINITY_DN71657_c0_g1~~TRINITY_DN71657_c0_g1_i1.p1  ORF type:complete len:332 (+),score=83.85 TRINITY_DN71657_c0_g1_i1:151-1146(+)
MVAALDVAPCDPALKKWLDALLAPPVPRAAGTAAEGGHVRTLSHPGAEDGVAFEEISLEAAVGSGSFGEVWRGSWRGQVVAVKRCKADNDKEAEMLVSEMTYLQRLRHPRLVSLLGFCTRQPHIFMLVEYMNRGSLQHALFVAKTRFLFKDQVRFGWQVAEALTYLHARGVVHRDVKSANVLLGEELSCKLCDFGLTVTLERSHLTVKGLQGSPRYMAPEQFLAGARITDKVDIWQMGCLLLELFCLSVPFKHCRALHEVANELLQRKQGPAIPSVAPPFARAVIAPCLRLQFRQRPSAVSLEEALGGLWKACVDAELERALDLDENKFCL